MKKGSSKMLSFQNGLRLPIFGIFIIGAIVGAVLGKIILEGLTENFEGRLVKQNGNVLTIETKDGKREDLELVLREGASIKLEGKRENNKIDLEELKVKPQDQSIIEKLTPQPQQSNPSSPSSLYPNPCSPGQVALYEGGQFSGCETPATGIEEPTSPQPTEPPTHKPKQPNPSSPSSPSSLYPNPCSPGQVALYEGGQFSGCETPAGGFP